MVHDPSERGEFGQFLDSANSALAERQTAHPCLSQLVSRFLDRLAQPSEAQVALTQRRRWLGGTVGRRATMVGNPKGSSSAPSGSAAGAVVHQRRWRLDRRMAADPPVGVLDRLRAFVDAEVELAEATVEVEAVVFESRSSADGLAEDVHLQIVGRNRS